MSDAELKELLALEKEALVDPGDARARLMGRLATQIQASPPATPSRGWPRGIGTGLGGLGVGIVVGAAVHSLVAPPPKVEIRYVDRVVEVARAADAAAIPAEVPVESLPAVVTAPPRIERAAPTASSSDEALAHERQVIEKARSALARHDADAALAAVDEHAKTFPRGQLVEMREALAVQALVAAGRNADARARADHFHRAFPGSMYSAVVDSAISSIP